MIIFISNVLRLVNSLNSVKKSYREVLVVVETTAVVLHHTPPATEHVPFLTLTALLWNGFTFAVSFRICAGARTADYSRVVDRVLRAGHG